DLIYSTYLGGSITDNAFGIDVDPVGNAYVTGSTDSPDFPLVNPADGAISSSEAFVSALNASGTALLYSTYLGGTQGDVGRGIAVDAGGNAYVTGETCGGFPLLNPFQPQFGGPCDAFVTKLSPTGMFVYSSYLGGSSFDEGHGIAVDPAGRVVLTGRASPSDFPTTPDALQSSSGGDADAFVTVLASDGSQLVFSTYLGGSGFDVGKGIAVDFEGNLYATGDTPSIDFPTTPGAFQTELGGQLDAFLVKIELEDNPLPTLESLLPSSTLAGGSSLTLTLTGSDFVPGSVALWNGQSRSTTFVSNTTLTTDITSDDIAVAGSAQVAVFNTGGGTSNTLPFDILNPVPTITSIVPDTIPAGSPAFTLTVNGFGFLNGVSVVRLDGVDRTTVFMSSTQLTAQIPDTDVATVGSRQITVFNPAPGGGTSNSRTFTISLRNPLPTVTSLSPPGVVGGAAGFMLGVNGSNFVFNSEVRWDGAARATTFLSHNQLQALIPATDLEVADLGAHPVSVFSPVPGGGTSNAKTFNVLSMANPPPMLASIDPTEAVAGSVRDTLPVMLTGANFINGSQVFWNGMRRLTSFMDSEHLLATIPASDLLTAGAAAVTVFTPLPGGGTSTPQLFTINNPMPTLTAINPDTAMSGDPAFTLTVQGAMFINGST
ncbi:MAG: SBBP repeat-containing protein, partial [bacterium]